MSPNVDAVSESLRVSNLDHIDWLYHHRKRRPNAHGGTNLVLFPPPNFLLCEGKKIGGRFFKRKVSFRAL